MKDYPSYSRDACTFEELFTTYSFDFVDVIEEVFRSRYECSRDFAERLFALAQGVACRFPDLELWDHLPSVLHDTMGAFDRKKGPFDALFLRNLKRRLRRESIRSQKNEAKRAVRTRDAAIVNRARLGHQPTDEECLYYRWSARLLDRAILQLDTETQFYVSRRREGTSVKAIATMLGTSAESLNNRYGGEKLANRVRPAVRQALSDLPFSHCSLLARHLVEEAGLTQDAVRTMLGINVSLQKTPVLDERSTLDVLGWQP
jgi:hypothetical protein